MASKRELQDLDQAETAEPVTKRAKRQTGATTRHQHQNSSIDPTWGQKYVFSSLEDATTIPYGQESDFEDDVDAMAYLQSVRREAYNIPHLLVAPKVGIDDAYYPASSQYQVYYDDGAYIAMRKEAPKFDPGLEDGQVDSDAEADAEADAQRGLLHESYFATVMKQYCRLRQLLHSKHPADWEKRLSSTQVPDAAAFGRNVNTNKVWAKLLRKTDPHPLQLALMSKETVLEVLRFLVGGTFLRRGHTVSERTSQWIWGLLARLPDRGELSHTEIACIRDLGRHAVLLGISLNEMAMVRDALSDEELGVHGGIDAKSDDEAAQSTESGDVEPGAIYDRLASPKRNGLEDRFPSLGNDGERCGTVDGSRNETDGETGEKQENEKEEKAEEKADTEEDGEIQEESSSGDDVGMDLDSGSEDSDAHDEDDDLEAAKMGLLAKLDGAIYTEQPLKENEEARSEAQLHRRMNMRATLNMILTVAGEFYGQRDLLDFRNPFVGL
ncbi:hypothetical protein E4U53_006996 [Claviceps sorghi]|nr:hypothetical protein E4U53_006996 [Claviceps sorghi]